MATSCLNLECSPIVQETRVQSQVESYKKLKKKKKKKKKRYLMPPFLTLSIIRYGSRVKWSNPGKGVAPSPTPQCSSYRKGSLWVTLDYSYQLYLLTLMSVGYRVHYQYPLGMTLNGIWWWGFSFGDLKCGVPLHCHYSRVHSDPEWWYQLEFYLWVK